MNIALSFFVLLVTISYVILWIIFKALKGRKLELEQLVQEKDELLTHALVSGRKAAEQAALAERSKKELLIKVNHAIRTPLNGILGTVTLLTDTNLSAEQKEYNETIRQCSEELLATINDELVKVGGGIDNVNNSVREETLDPNRPKPTLSDAFAKQFPLRILIAEDDRINQRLAKKTLTKLGYAPDIAQNGKEVLEEVSKVNYDLILMDVQMPEMDGLEATRMIRLCLTNQPVIIAMTANAMGRDREECLQAGMDDYISKPVHLEELVIMLEKWAMQVSKAS